jgi:glycosyltransferase involved in cell wall biosynthesis
MKILVAATITPFIHGGADNHIHGLVRALNEAGHNTELLRLPFKFEPASDVERSMDYATGLDLNNPNGIQIDRVISLQFPAWGLQHAEHWAWVMHQHRAVYELYDDSNASSALRHLRIAVTAFDQQALSKGVQKLFANSARVAERLAHYNGLSASTLYHPPAHAEKFYCEPAQPYIFMPSRLETLKRQSLLIEAASLMRTPLSIVFAGDGGQRDVLAAQTDRLALHDRIRFLGHITEAEKRAFYAHCLAVCFPAFDEDYGYITLEAMLSSKPVVTCTDSGGPLEFIQHGENGWIDPPDAQALATRLDWLYQNQQQAAQAGKAARASYEAAGLSWQNVVAQLTRPHNAAT